MQSCKHENKHNITTLEMMFQNIKFLKFSEAACPWPLFLVVHAFGSGVIHQRAQIKETSH